MGCDIHAYMEFRKPQSEQWDSWPRINLGRNYLMFGKLAGVRSDGPPVVEPRGIPADLGWDANDDWWLLVHDEHEGDGWATSAQAASYAKYGSKIIQPGEAGNPGTVPRVEHPDWHTPSWVTADELLTAIAAAAEDEWPQGLLEYRAMAAAMKEIERQGYECRLVFWFDN